MKHAAFLVLSVLFAVAATASARDLTTTAGVTYTNASLVRVEPDGITIKYDGGLTKLHPSQLPQELREKFHFNAKDAAQYAKKQAEAVQLANARRDAAVRLQREEQAKLEAAEKRKKEWDEKTQVWYLKCDRSDERGIYCHDKYDVDYVIYGWKAMPGTWFTIEAVSLGRIKLSDISSAIKLVPHPIPESRKKKK